MTAGYDLEYPRFDSYELLIFGSSFMKFVFRTSVDIKELWQDCDTGDLNSITVRREYLLVFQFWYC